jgi:hypothetical protein
MQYGDFMKTEEIRSLLVEKAKKRGELKRFCKSNDLPYFTLWRFASRKTDKLDHNLGSKLTVLLSDSTSHSGEAANA